MGRVQHFQGVYAREASILVSFQFQGRRCERLALLPTPQNLRAAARIRDDVQAAISIGKFTLADYRSYFPDSVWLRNHQQDGASVTLRAVAETWFATRVDCQRPHSRNTATHWST